jgi:hypothetical protein
VYEVNNPDQLVHDQLSKSVLFFVKYFQRFYLLHKALFQRKIYLHVHRNIDLLTFPVPSKVNAIKFQTYLLNDFILPNKVIQQRYI